MIYLVDTNIWLERLLEQEKNLYVKKFLDQVPSELLCISDFSLHSIAVILFKHKKYDIFEKFINDIFHENEISVISIPSKSLNQLSKISVTYGLDLDDAYQYWIAKNCNLILVSYDKDFDRTDLKVKTPEEILQ